MQLITHTADEMELLGAKLAAHCPKKSLIFLQGELGSGKTTLVRGFLRALGYQATVKSPTYTLVESYELTTRHVYHFDLYRLRHPQELIAIGISDYLSDAAICLIEWPENAGVILPKPDLLCVITVINSARQVELIASDEVMKQFYPLK